MTASPSSDPDSVHRLLAARGLTVAVAESLTGGLLSAALTSSPGSSATFRGGLVVYATDLKARLADVSRPLLDAQGPVSADVAQALASGARRRLSADLGVGITGVAGPDPIYGHPAGTVFLAVAGADTGAVSRVELAGSRTEIREAAVAAALDLLLSVVCS
ncbi:MAG: CinA family protein [Geodermatophilaceae bacterium]|nr:CinA family protein [Geodermatophilaceae bacterium]MDQ3476420.1 CinA family protein [Actinomycetota bacterium]